MNVPHDEFDELEDITDAERDFLRSLYEFPPEVRDARGLSRLIVAADHDAQASGRSAELALERASEDVSTVIGEALGPDAARRRERNRSVVSLAQPVLD